MPFDGVFREYRTRFLTSNTTTGGNTEKITRRGQTRHRRLIRFFFFLLSTVTTKRDKKRLITFVQQINSATLTGVNLLKDKSYATAFFFRILRGFIVLTALTSSTDKRLRTAGRAYSC